MRCLMITFLFILMIHCAPPAAVGTFPPEIDIQLKNLRPLKEKALIYVLRPERVIYNHKIQITCDGEFIGYTLGGTYLAFFVDPGMHFFTSEDSIRIVDDFTAFYEKRKSNKFRLLSSGNEKENAEKQTEAHMLFIKKQNYIMKCLRSQNILPEDINHVLKNKPMPLEMYHVVSVHGGETHYLIQSFKSELNWPLYLLDECDSHRGQAFLEKLRHSRYIDPAKFPRDYIRLPQK